MLLVPIFIIFLILYIYSINKLPRKFPPGPFRLPIIGSLYIYAWKWFVGIILNKTVQPLWIQFTDLSRNYGPIFNFRMGGTDFIILNNQKTIQDAFKHWELCGSPRLKSFECLNDGKDGIFYNKEQCRIETRALTVRIMKTLTRQNDELGLKYSLHILFSWISSFNQSNINSEELYDQILVRLSAQMLYILFGKEFWRNNEFDEEDLKNRVKSVYHAINQSALIGIYPDICEKFPALSGLDRYLQAIKPFQDLIKQTMSSSIYKNEPLKCFVNEFYEKISSSTNKESLEANTRAISSDLFIVSVKTLSRQLLWGILYVSKHPTVQKRIRDEIGFVIGESFVPNTGHKALMPYTYATILELLRIVTANPLGFEHQSSEDVSFGAYKIPKNTWILANLYHANRDPEYWSEPDCFNPERFLLSNGEIDKSKPIFSFSVGRRTCRKQITLDVLFVYITSILQKYDLVLNQTDQNWEEPLNDNPNSLPKPFKVTFKDRTTH